MKRLLASLLFLLPIFLFSNASQARADCTVSKSDPLVVACATAFGKPTDAATINTCAILMCAFGDKSASNNGPWYNQTATQFAHKVFDGSPDEIFGERYTYAQINWIINSLLTMLNPAAGLDMNGVSKLIGDLVKIIKDGPNNLPNPINITYIKENGVLGFASTVMGSLYINPPASGTKEIKNIAARFDLAQPALAQGYGYSGLQSSGGILKLWQATRNMSYFLMIILLIASGFLIMFRVKINPQTVISIQTMIPKLIITMILVTFSFAIAGFVIDMIYVIIGLFVGILAANGMFNFNVTGGSIQDVIWWLTNSNFAIYAILRAWGIFQTVILGAVVGIVGLLTTGPAGPIVGIIAFLGFFIWANVTLFKIFFMLVKAYVMLILQIIIGPLQIMLDLLPGQQGFGPWIRNLIANASVFVVVPIMLVLQGILSWDPIMNNALHLNTVGTGSSFGLPFAEIAGNALSSGNLITMWVIGFMIFTMTPKIADIIRDMLKIPAFKYGAAITEGFAPYRDLLNQGLEKGTGEIMRKPRSEAEARAVMAEGQLKQPGGLTPANVDTAVKARTEAQNLQFKSPKV